MMVWKAHCLTLEFVEEFFWWTECELKFHFGNDEVHIILKQQSSTKTKENPHASLHDLPHLSCEHLDPRRKKIKSQPHQVFSLLTFIKCMLKKNTGLLLLPFKGFTWGKQITEVLQYHKKHFSNWQNLLSLHTHCALWTFWYPSVGARS